MIATVNARDDIPEANVSNLTKAEKHGRELFAQRCANCHTLQAASAVAQVGPNLDDLRPPKNLVLDAIDKGRARGNGAWPPGSSRARTPRTSPTFVAKAVGQSGERRRAVAVRKLRRM